MGQHLVLVGAGHAHMLTLANLRYFIDKGHRVTVVGPSAYQYYSGMGPGMLGKIYTPQAIRFRTQHMAEKNGAAFLLDKVVRIDPDKKTITLESGEQTRYDVISFNIGSHVPCPPTEGNDSDIFTVKPVEGLLAAQRRLLELGAVKDFNLGIVGGGPSSAEIAGNVHRLLQDHAQYQAQITIFSGEPLMAQFPQAVRSRVINSLTRRSIHIVEEDTVTSITDKELLLASGRRAKLDFLFIATGVKPAPIFTSSGLPTGPDGGLLVNDYLQSTAHPDIFGGGDCIYFQNRPLDKVGVYAVRQNPVLLHNLQAHLEEEPVTPFEPGGDYLLVFNMGDGTGVLRKRKLVLNGRLAFRIKDWIDRKFMKTFQGRKTSQQENG